MIRVKFAWPLLFLVPIYLYQPFSLFCVSVVWLGSMPKENKSECIYTESWMTYKWWQTNQYVAFKNWRVGVLLKCINSKVFSDYCICSAKCVHLFTLGDIKAHIICPTTYFQHIFPEKIVVHVSKNNHKKSCCISFFPGNVYADFVYSVSSQHSHTPHLPHQPLPLPPGMCQVHTEIGQTRVAVMSDVSYHR